jgi:abortive infection bacteriophage resistance protein
MIKAAYTKAALTYQQQLEQLKERGLYIPDEDYFLHLLEVNSFGSLSVMYSNLKPDKEKREIANVFGFADKVFSSWLHSIVYLRKVCAHHARLWNRVMSIQPLIPHKPRNEWIGGKSVENDTTYYILSMLVYLK